MIDRQTEPTYLRLTKIYLHYFQNIFRKKAICSNVTPGKDLGRACSCVSNQTPFAGTILTK